MSFEPQEPNVKLPKGFIGLHYFSANNTSSSSSSKNNLTDASRVRKQQHSAPAPRPPSPPRAYAFEGGRPYERQKTSFPQANVKKKSTKKSYFSIESLFLLTCLTASLLILPLVLPPLPPPPFLLLLLPIGILGILMTLAFMPSKVRDLTYV